MTREQFLKEIKSIGLSTRGIYPNEFIWDSEGKKTLIRVRQDCIEYRISEMIILVIHFDKIKIEIDKEGGWESLTISDINSGENYGFFVQMYNKP